MLPLRTESLERPALHLRASNDLSFIRRTMERASSFTAVPGWGAVWIGCVALVAALFAGPIEQPDRWLAAWLFAALAAGLVGVVSMLFKARRARVSLFSGPGARFIVGLAPPLIAGMLLTWIFYRSDMVADLPGVWLLMYGVTILAAGTFSIRPVVVMGLCFFLLGCIALPSPPALAGVFMAVGFGGLHILFGLLIARRHGG